MNSFVCVGRLLLLIVGCHMLIAQPTLAWKPDFVPPPDQLKQMEKRNDKWRAQRNTRALLYGKVVDFSGEPVGGAVVTMRLSAVPTSVLDNDQRLVNTVTDSNGSFQLEETGFMFYLAEIKRDGYQFKMDYIKERHLDFKPGVKAKGKGYQPDKPMVFRIRKKSAPSFAFSGSFGFILRNGESKLLDLYRRQWARPDRLITHKMSYPDWYADVRASVEEDGDKFRLILESLDPDSGFVIEAPEFFEEMTEAPEQGYRPKLVIPFTKIGGGQLFAYIKSAGGLFYSKLRVSYSHSKGRDYVELSWGYRTNMEGGRDLVYSDKLYSQYLLDEREGRRHQALRKQRLNGETVAPMIEQKQ